MNRRRLDDLERRIGVLVSPLDDGPVVRVYVPDDGRNPESTILGDTDGPVVIYDPNALP